MVDFFFSTTKVRNPPGILRMILTLCLHLADYVRNDAANLMFNEFPVLYESNGTYNDEVPDDRIPKAQMQNTR